MGGEGPAKPSLVGSCSLKLAGFAAGRGHRGLKTAHNAEGSGKSATNVKACHSFQDLAPFGKVAEATGAVSPRKRAEVQHN